MRTRDLNRLPKVALDALGDRSGSVATIFAVALVPVMIAAGIGIDLARATSSRGALQDALDATALAVAHLPANTPQADLEAKATTWLNANLNNPSLQGVNISVALANGKAVLTASSAVPTTLTAIAGYRTMPISATSTVEWGLGHVEVALVLDNTGSMRGTKLARLKSAAADLVDTLSESTDSSDPNALKISVVPFAATVKIGSSYKTSTWMKSAAPKQYFPSNDLKLDLFRVSSTTNRFPLFDSLGEAWAGCIESRPAPYDVQDTAPASATPATLFVPYFAPDEPDDDTVAKTYYGSTVYSWWSDAPNNYRTDNPTAAATATNAWWTRQSSRTKYNGSVGSGGSPNAGCGMQSLVRLTTNMATVKSKISAMNADGNTNIPIGLMWGWHTLSPNLPFGDGGSYTDPDIKKFVVLLTDGDNTNDVVDNPNRSSYSALGYMWQKRLMGPNGVTPLDETSTAAQRTAAMDARMVVACNNMKAKGIIIYTVRIDVSGSSPAALSSCASSSDKFYDIDSSGLSDAFANIAGSIGRLRISK